ncbi:ATP-dependent DNA helicase [Lacticaseibacillus brantae]|uniref:Superfamily II DNA and RNA helicase n=1 Tax=Lacticaseibacillus brantae DSM 23927 TaxID=1423727 RepID=A0A0R2B6T4_9LACO|nr:ATP-dependent DNA helicase [Lacticaseibacillus brantae]KRM71347.1 Superfamily II DNA and RNA helicase [Lacticaseibacillus brantae DSM 23927]
MAETKIGVRELVELTVRTGDLNPVTTASNNTAMLGSKIHRQLQAAHTESDFEKEVYLEHPMTINATTYLINGRADGVLTDESGVTIEEIKTSARNFADVTQNTKDRYWSQLYLYGLFLCESRDLDQVQLDLIYYQTSTDQVSRFTETKTRAELSLYFEDLIAAFKDWLDMRQAIVDARNQSAKTLAFPFPEFRTGQREMAAAVYKTIYAQTRLFVEAPTGTGKTISTLFPAIKAMGEGLIERLFYLTAKQSTRRVAEDGMALLAANGLVAKSITLTAKDVITFDDEPDDPSLNPYMLGYYDRLKPALKDMFAHENQLTRGVIETYAQKHTLDPFEFSLDASLFCDVVICDYNYLFDPTVFLQRFFSEPDPGNFFLVDEAHNLISRARSMYSASIEDGQFVSLKDALKGHKGKIFTSLRRRINRVLDEFDLLSEALSNQKLHEHYQKDSADGLVTRLNQFSQTIHDWLGSDPAPELQPITEIVLPVYFAANQFLRINDFYNDAYETRIANDHGVMVKALCLDPSNFIDQSLALGRGAVLFSATLSPIHYYQEILGGLDNSLAYQLPSPFDQRNLKLIATSNIQTTYQQRAANLPTIVASLETLIAAKPGNYLFFFPSYQYLEQVYTAFAAAHPTADLVVQAGQMDEAARKDFLAQFSADSQTIGFAVLGGIFSEGIDLKGTRLIGVAIISVGLPGLNSETDRLKAYYDAQNGQGFAYAYQLPGLNNVLQAAGRVIRGEHDCGVILLLDQRFATPRYRALFPNHWQGLTISRSTSQLAEQLRHFWEDHG